MNTTVKVLALAAALSAAPAVAQDRTAGQAAQPGKVGIGVGISTAGNANVGQTVFVPINVTPKFRLEPFFGWARADIDAAPPTSGGAAFAPGPGKSSDFTLGLGGFYVAPVASQVQLYLGARLASQWESLKDTAGNKWDRRNTLLAPALGAEYLPHPRIALGGEVMLGMLWFGDTDFPNGTSGAGGNGSFTQGTLFARFYLF